jgi:predicted transposase/invertase (TIGR01784 family)
MPIERFLNPKNDYAFKQIFGIEKNRDILTAFLNGILSLEANERVIDVTLLKTSQDREISAYRRSIVDVLCRDQNNVQFIVEMQIDWHKGFEKRAQFYAARAYSRQRIEEDENHKKMAIYAKLKGVIFIAISDFILFPEKKEWVSEHRITDTATYENDLKDFRFLFMELPKFKKTLSELTNITEKWAYFFKHAEHTSLSEMEQLIGENVELKRAFQVIDQATWTEAQLLEYEDIEKEIMDAMAIEEAKLERAEAKGREGGREEGEAIGIDKGKIERNIEVAKNLLLANVSVDIISSSTCLSVLEIEKLRL